MAEKTYPSTTRKGKNKRVHGSYVGKKQYEKQLEEAEIPRFQKRKVEQEKVKEKKKKKKKKKDEMEEESEDVRSTPKSIFESITKTAGRYLGKIK